MEQVSSGRSYFSSTRIACIAMFATLAGILYIFKFPLPFAFPGFLEFKFADIPILIGSFTLGPISGAIIVVVGILIKLVFKGTTTMFVGDLSDVLTSCAFAVVAGIIYSKKRTFKGALAAMGLGTLAEVIVALLANRFILIPFFSEAYGWDAIIGMMNKLFPGCTRETFYNYYLWVSVLPFNLLRCLVTILVTLPVYKHISVLINRLNTKLTPKNDENGVKTKKINIISLVVGIAIILILVLFALLHFFVFSKMGK